MQFEEMTALVQNFDHLQSKESSALLALQEGVKITVYLRKDSGGLGGPLDVWAAKLGDEQVLSLEEAAAAHKSVAWHRYKLFLLLLVASLVAWWVGAWRQRASAA
jgi:hypothetical protein